MKFESFAVTSAASFNETNCENYFLNGLCKDDVAKKEAFGENLAFGKKDIYAVADGSESDASGEEAAFTAVNILRDFLGSDFARTYETFFGAANADIAGRIFENNKKKEYADMAVLYINRRKARIYNIGDSSVFMLHGDKFRKLSGNPPETVMVDDESVGPDGELIFEAVEKKVGRLLGVETENYAVCPYVSNKINVCKNDSFLICSKGVTDNVSEDMLKSILAKRNLPIDEKVSAIVQKAVEQGSKSNATAVLVQSKRGFDFSWIKSKVFVCVIAFLILVLLAVSSKDIWYRPAKYFYDMYIRYDDIVESVELEPWTPIDVPCGDDEQEEETPEEVVPEPETEISENNTGVEGVPANNRPNGNTVKRPKPVTPPAPDKDNVVKQPETNAVQPVVPAPQAEAPKPDTDTGGGAKNDRTVVDEVELPIDFNN